MTRIVHLNPTAKGLAFTRLAITAALTKSDTFDGMSAVALPRFGEDSLAYRIGKAGGVETLATIKAEVAAGSTISGTWASLLVEAESATAEFFGLVRERSVLGRLPLRSIPLRTRMIGAATGFSAAWLGEGKSAPVSSAIFNQEQLDPLKVGTLTVITDELLRSVDPAAETTIRDDMVGAIAEAINASFLDPLNAGEAEVEPASITYDAPSVAATGDGLADLRLLIDAYPGDLETAVLVGSGKSFAAMHDPVALPGLGVRGGQALGIPAIPTKAAGDTVTLLDPAGIAWGAGSTDIRTSSEATIEMTDEPTQDSTVPTGAQQVSLFQTNATALLATTAINWKAVRPAAAVLEGVPQS